MNRANTSLGTSWPPLFARATTRSLATDGSTSTSITKTGKVMECSVANSCKRMIVRSSPVKSVKAWFQMTALWLVMP